MKYLFSVLSVGLLLGAGCAHLDSTNSTFEHSDDMLQLKVERHMDEIMDGPDTEEDQTLILQLRDFKIGERLTVPSAKAAVNFVVDRFGPISEGDEFQGSVIVLSDNGKKVKAHLDLVVTARTRDHRYTQKAKFNGDFYFIVSPSWNDVRIAKLDNARLMYYVRSVNLGNDSQGS